MSSLPPTIRVDLADLPEGGPYPWTTLDNIGVRIISRVIQGAGFRYFVVEGASGSDWGLFEGAPITNVDGGAGFSSGPNFGFACNWSTSINFVRPTTGQPELVQSVAW